MALVNEIKLSEGCKDCGYRENVNALQFDHILGTKTACVTALLGRNINVLTAEILKCEVRCANCHAIATSNRRNQEKSLG